MIVSRGILPDVMRDGEQECVAATLLSSGRRETSTRQAADSDFNSETEGTGRRRRPRLNQWNRNGGAGHRFQALRVEDPSRTRSLRYKYVGVKEW